MKQNRNKLIHTGNRPLITKGREKVGADKICKGDKEVYTSNFKINKSQGC